MTQLFRDAENDEDEEAAAAAVVSCRGVAPGRAMLNMRGGDGLDM